MLFDRIFNFLIGIEENNNKEWFNEHKSEYEIIKRDLFLLTSLLINGTSKFDKEIANIQAKDCLFRINRDVRFSKNKNPYKTYLGIFLSKGGKKASNAGYYLHIENNNSFIGGGIYMPESAKLKLIRKEIYYNIDEFKKIIYANDFVNAFEKIWDDNPLKKAPNDFSADFKDIELLKYRNYTVLHKLTNDEVCDLNFSSSVIHYFKILFPFNSFINKAIDFIE